MAIFGVASVGTLGEPFSELEGRGKIIVSGNHDIAAIGDEVIRRFNPRGRVAAEWTATQLNDDEKRYISTLPIKTKFERATLVHSSPENPTDFAYILSAADARIALENSEDEMVFIGHTHKPIVFELGVDMRVLRFDKDITLQPGARYIVNVGSVGQPRDRDNRAAYVIWDTEKDTLQLRRVEYDIEMAADKIIAAGLPKELGQRLFVGR